jgi:uncharacterized protein (TIGR02996 family)
VSVGAAAAGDIQLVGHNIAARHVLLHFTKSRVGVEVRSAYGVRIDGRPPRADPQLSRGGLLEIGPWWLRLEPDPPSGIDAVDEPFLETLARQPDAIDARLVYADSLEERGRVAEAELVRGPLPEDVSGLAVRTPPAWRRRLLPIAIEGCAVEACPRAWSALARDAGDAGDDASRTCGACGRRVALLANLGAAREHALRGRPLAVDPAVRRWPNDLREPVVKRPAIDMGQPVRPGRDRG